MSPAYGSSTSSRPDRAGYALGPRRSRQISGIHTTADVRHSARTLSHGCITATAPAMNVVLFRQSWHRHFRSTESTGTTIAGHDMRFPLVLG